MADTSIAPGKTVTVLDDWTKKLAESGKATGTTLTIGSATVSATLGVTTSSVTPATTGVIFKVNTSGYTGAVPGEFTVTTNGTLSNGDTEASTHTIQITNT